MGTRAGLLGQKGTKGDQKWLRKGRWAWSPVWVLLHTRGGGTLLSYLPLRLSVLVCGMKGSVRGGSKLASCLSLAVRPQAPSDSLTARGFHNTGHNMLAGG